MKYYYYLNICLQFSRYFKLNLYAVIVEDPAIIQAKCDMKSDVACGQVW